VRPSLVSSATEGQIGDQKKSKEESRETVPVGEGFCGSRIMDSSEKSVGSSPGKPSKGRGRERREGMGEVKERRKAGLR